VSTKGIRCPHCYRELWLSIYAVTYYCICGRKLEVKKCKKVPARPTKKDKKEMERGRRLFALQCLIHAEGEPEDLREGKSVPAVALQYGASAKLTKAEVDAVLKMTVEELLAEEGKP